jgi:hypothetical protein
MFIALRMNITDNQGSRACLMNTGKNSIVDQPELVMAVILLSLKRAICQKPLALATV